MLSIIKSMALNGIDGYLIEVQVDITSGLPSFEIVGLPSTSIKEAKERIKSAIKNSQINFPSKKILVNLAPADIKKEGTIYDLPMAIGILIAIQKISRNKIKDTIIVGELSLDGKINAINGVLPMCIEAMRLGIKTIILPKENEKEACLLKGLNVIGVTNLKQVINYLNNEIEIKSKIIEIEEIMQRKKQYKFDFSDVKGQENMKRALEIAATGGHNCILIGSPGARKDNDSKKITIYFARFNI